MFTCLIALEERGRRVSTCRCVARPRKCPVIELQPEQPPFHLVSTLIYKCAADVCLSSFFMETFY